MLKKYRWLLLIAGGAVAYWLWRKFRTPALAGGLSAVDGYPNAERATPHFTWDELLTGSGLTYADLTQDQVDGIVAIARFVELVRKLNGDLPIVCNVVGIDTNYTVTLKPDVPEKITGLSQSVGDAVANLSGYGGAVSSSTGTSTVSLYGDTATLVSAVASGVAAV